MIQRLATAAVLSAAVAALFSPSFAQTVIGTAVGGISSSTGGNSVISTLPSPAPQGGTMTISQGAAGVSSSQSGTVGTTATPTTATPSSAPPLRNAQAKPRYTDNLAQAPRRAARPPEADAAEQQITECLNDAAAQGQSADSCKR